MRGIITEITNRAKDNNHKNSSPLLAHKPFSCIPWIKDPPAKSTTPMTKIHKIEAAINSSSLKILNFIAYILFERNYRLMKPYTHLNLFSCHLNKIDLNISGYNLSINIPNSELFILRNLESHYCVACLTVQSNVALPFIVLNKL